MNYVLIEYGLYVGISAALTLWVGRTLYRNGRVFLIDAFHGSEARADSVNHLLKVGFYLLNFGLVLLGLRLGEAPQDEQQMVEILSTKLGAVLVLLGLMHFFNMFNFESMRRKGRRTAPPLPVEAFGGIKM